MRIPAVVCFFHSFCLLIYKNISFFMHAGLIEPNSHGSGRVVLYKQQTPQLFDHGNLSRSWLVLATGSSDFLLWKTGFASPTLVSLRVPGMSLEPPEWCLMHIASR
ncbi:hypothetical protein BJX61DRAFT_523706 [Aspergillus egyptiacus]|nr:hypothetical protein BJX61DRAFT_523706 [Aspergillus egyptiacus]